MDANVNVARKERVAPARGAMPERAPLTMPTQALDRVPDRIEGVSASLGTWWARLITALTTIGMTGYAVYEMLTIVNFSQMTILQGVMIFFFSVTFAWIAFAASSAIAGLLTPQQRAREAPIAGSRTALVMPIYNEDPLHTTASLQAMAESLRAHDHAEFFEIVLLSDTREADPWIRESLAVQQLRDALLDFMPVWYRRRPLNTARKSGNLEDFVKQWGARYDYMIVLDADSLMDAQTLIALIARMQADPKVGILQTVPTLIEGRSVFARLQQFAARVYGPPIARGMASWSGNEGNYWGHNAAIRVEAFAQCCGLPQLPGRKPFGGPVLSHDFVEAALMRRGGWKVRMALDLHGSWEGSPPTLMDVAVRDRRWAQGNLQHSKVIGTRGLRLTNRLHFAIGIMSYLSSPMWMALLLIGFALTLQAQFTRPEYFPEEFQLFPDWPTFDAQRMVGLFLFSMAVLLVPKLLGLVRTLVSNAKARAAGGRIRLLLSVPVEVILSALYAPISMLMQTRHVLEILTGRDSGWNAQRRNADRLSWREVWRFHRGHTAMGLLIGALALYISPSLFAWLSPALLGLLLATPLSKLSGSRTIGHALLRVGIFGTPEEREPPAVLQRRRVLEAERHHIEGDMLEYLARDAHARAAHIHRNLPRPTEPRGRPDPHRLVAEQMLADARSLTEALQWLGPAERVQVASDARLLERLATLAHQREPAALTSVIE